MKHWEQVIVEWINCLDILKDSLKSTEELQNGTLYTEYLNLISWTKYKYDCSQKDIITKFIEDQYPSFKINKDDEAEHIYIASLLLVHTSQTTMFHTPMCIKLKHETQIRIKIFLENILPLGRDITKETMREVIVEVEEGMSKISNSHQTSPLKDFVNSPALRSARSSYKIMTERIRELRELKCNLDIERFKNEDLQNDLMNQQDKIQSLKKKLEEKSALIKVLKEERIRPNSPQCSHKEEDALLCEDYYKKYINNLENQLNKQQDEIDNLETQKDALSKALTSVQRDSMQYKESFKNCERSLESLSNKIEMKNRELIELKIHNKELRAHIEEFNKNSITEQSFEIEDSVMQRTATSLNTSEALSSVIEIQLQEAREESAILLAQVDSLKDKLDIITKDYRNSLESNRTLQEKLKVLDKMQAELNNVQKDLHMSDMNIKNLQAEKISLIAQSEDLKSLLSSKEKEFFEKEQLNIILNTKLNNLKIDMENLNELLGLEINNSSDLSIALAHIRKLIDERDSYKLCIENCSKNIRDILQHDDQFKINDLDNLTLNDLINHFGELLRNYNGICASHEDNLRKLEVEKSFLEGVNLFNQQWSRSAIATHYFEKANNREENRRNVSLINEQKKVIHDLVHDITVLEKIKDQKCILEENVRRLENELIDQQQLSKSTVTYLKDCQNIMKEFKLMKQEIQQEFMEHQKSVTVTFEKIYHDFDKIKSAKQELKCNFDCNKEELSNVQAINAELTQNLVQYKDMVNVLEKSKKHFSDELNKSQQDIKVLNKVNEICEKRYAKMEVKTNNDLENLKSENIKISLELKNTIEKLDLLQQEMVDVMTQMELKDAYINGLALNVSSLKAEKNHLMHSHEESTKMLIVKDEEIKLKEEALQTLQATMETLVYEARDSEEKMKSIIMDLQDTKAIQEGILRSQEIALNQKCIDMKELQKQFDESKELNQRLEDERKRDEEMRRAIIELEQANIQEEREEYRRTIEELQEKLKLMDTELKEHKDYYKIMEASQEEIVKLCQELEHPTKNLDSTIKQACPDFDILGYDLHDKPQYEYSYTNDKNEVILNIIKMALYELHISRKVILHLSFTKTEINNILKEQDILIEDNAKNREEICNLKNKIQELEIVARKRNEYLKSLIKNKEFLKDSLQKILASCNDSDSALISLKQKWDETLVKFQDVLCAESSVCEFKQLQAKKTIFENILCKYHIDHLESIISISDILWEKFLWTEKKLHNTYLCSIHEKECLDVLTNAEENQFSQERIIINMELKKNKILQTNLMKSEEEIRTFTFLATSYENCLKSGEIKTWPEIEKKLHDQISQLTKEKKDLNSKMDNMRSRNVKLERNMDELRTEIKKLKLEVASKNYLEEIQSLKTEIEHLKEQNQKLHEERDKSNQILKQEFENQGKEIYASYEQKLEDIKQKMKKTYKEQVAKLSSDQEHIIQNQLRIQKESMCQKQREEINRYKAHVGELSSQLWDIGEKLLIQQQEKQNALQQLKEIQTKIKELEAKQTISLKACKLEKQELLSPDTNAKQITHKMTIITKEAFEKRHNVRNIQTLGNAFKAEDEEEIFDNVYLADIQRENRLPIMDTDRLSVLQMRNAKCKPHLKSSYPAEMQFLPSTLTEEDIKTGSVTEDIFNDSLSQSLLPEQKVKKRDRSQTSYKKPGPPTPSKNGGRLSLQGNELRSPNARILRERNIDKRTTTTPHALKQLFTLKRQDDQNINSTPKSRRLSNLFRKPRLG